MKWDEIGLGNSINSIKSCGLYCSYCHKYIPCKMDMVMGYSGLDENFTDSLIEGSVKRMNDDRLREMLRYNYAAQMEMLGYQSDGNPKDLVEVVRCKDCRHGAPTIINGTYLSVTCGDVDHRPDWFCADG